jgi:acyl-coenzyme A thioesterase PaaI-like protein
VAPKACRARSASASTCALPAPPTRARGEIFKLGRRISHVRVIAWQEERDRPVAAGNGKFLMA